MGRAEQNQVLSELKTAAAEAAHYHSGTATLDALVTASLRRFLIAPYKNGYFGGRPGRPAAGHVKHSLMPGTVNILLARGATVAGVDQDKPDGKARTLCGVYLHPSILTQVA